MLKHSLFWYKHLQLAYVFLTRLPSPKPHNLPPYTAEALWAFIPIGLVIGIISAALGWGMLAIGLPERIAAWGIVASAAIITGALHEDGLCDVLDGFFSKQSAEQRIAIMKKPDIGVFAILGLIISKSLEAELIHLLLVNNPLFALSVVAILHAVSRGFFGLSLRLVTPIKTAKQNLAQNLGKPSYLCLAISLLQSIALLCWFGNIIAAMIIFASLLGFIIAWGYFCKSKIGGINGDCLGASQQLALLVGLILYNVI